MNWISWCIAGLAGVLALAAFVAGLERCMDYGDDA